MQQRLLKSTDFTNRPTNQCKVILAEFGSESQVKIAILIPLYKIVDNSVNKHL